MAYHWEELTLKTVFNQLKANYNAWEKRKRKCIMSSLTNASILTPSTRYEISCKKNLVLITIGLIVDLLATLVPLKKTVFLIKQTRKIQTVFIPPVSRINARINRSKKMWRFIVFRDVEISTWQKKKIYHVNNFDWMNVKLCMYAT